MLLTKHRQNLSRMKIWRYRFWVSSYRFTALGAHTGRLLFLLTLFWKTYIASSSRAIFDPCLLSWPLLISHRGWGILIDLYRSTSYYFKHNLTSFWEKESSNNMTHWIHGSNHWKLLLGQHFNGFSPEGQVGHVLQHLWSPLVVGIGWLVDKLAVREGWLGVCWFWVGWLAQGRWVGLGGCLSIQGDEEVVRKRHPK